MENIGLDVEFLKVLADNNRMAILNFLKDGEKSFKQIANQLQKTQSIISSNLKLLSQENLIESRLEHGNKFFKIKNPKILGLLQQISNFVTEKVQENILNRSVKHAKDIL